MGLADRRTERITFVATAMQTHRRNSPARTADLFFLHRESYFLIFPLMKKSVIGLAALLGFVIWIYSQICRSSPSDLLGPLSDCKKSLLHAKAHKRALAMDFGYFHGANSRTWLEHGYEVVAVEADAELAEKARTMWKDTPWFHLHEGAVRGFEHPEEVTFWINDNKVWSSVRKSVGCKKTNGSDCRPLLIRNTFTCDRLLQESGQRPLIVSIDMDGVNDSCLRQILARVDKCLLPKYVVSFMNADDLRSSETQGYTRCKVVPMGEVREGEMVPFGEYAVGLTQKGQRSQQWQTIEECLATPCPSWCAIHMKIDMKKHDCKPL